MIGLVLLFIGWSTSAWASGGSDPVADTDWGQTSIGFQMKVNQATALTVSGPGVYLQMDFNAGKTPGFLAVDEANNPLPDGRYIYELRTIPEEDQSALVEADRSGDTRRLAEIFRARKEKTLVQSASFEIVSGQIVPP